MNSVLHPAGQKDLQPLKLLQLPVQVNYSRKKKENINF